MSGAAHRGPVAGLLTSQRFSPPSDATVAMVDATSMTTVDNLMGTFAQAWDFPSYFGRNRDAFDECMRELEPTTPERILLTHITNASSLLVDDPDQLGWFIDSLQFYRRHYRDIAAEPDTFAVLLSTDPGDRADVESRWWHLGVHLPQVKCEAEG